MVYLLLFQRDIVERSLEDISPITGREFIEKIVQVGFDIPRIERSRMERVLFSGLNELLSEKILNNDSISIGGANFSSRRKTLL